MPNETETSRPAAPSSAERLDSWKEIATYLKCSVRTVRRWETEGLPVHRHAHKKKSAIYAYKPEIDVWWNDGRAQLEKLERADANEWQRWLQGLAAGLVLVLVIVMTAIYGVRSHIWRSRQTPMLTEKDTIVLGDFTNSTGDPVFDGTLREGLSVQLEQSPFLSILSGEKVRDTLKLMGHPSHDRLMPDLARELCQRAGSKAYVSGSIASLGSQYVLGLHAVDCSTGDSLAQEQVQAAHKEDVLNALGDASKELRNKLGESLKTVQKYDTPLAQASTPSLEALKALSLGQRATLENGIGTAIPFLKRAIELDPNFAIAYTSLGGMYSDLGEPGLAAENIQKAYQLRDRVSEHERFVISTLYYVDVTRELEKAIQTCELWAEAYPRDSGPHDLSGVSYEFLGQYQKAVTETLQAIRLDPDLTAAYENLMQDYAALNRLGEVKATYRQALERRREGIFLHADLYGIAFLQGDTAEMQRQVDWATGKPGAEDWLLSYQSDTEAFSGRLEKARAFSRSAVESALHNDEKETAALWQMNAALREAEFGNPEQARQKTEAALAMASSRDVQILAALALARAGDSARASAITEDLEKRVRSNIELNDYWLPTVRASIAIYQGNSTRALKALEIAAPYELALARPLIEDGGLLYPVYVRGLAYLAMGRGREAAAEFQKFIDHRGVVENSSLGALAHLNLARAYSLQGDTGKVRAAYQDFLILSQGTQPRRWPVSWRCRG